MPKEVIISRIPHVDSVSKIPIYPNALWLLDLDGTLVSRWNNQPIFCDPKVLPWLNKIHLMDGSIDIITARNPSFIEGTINELNYLQIPYRNLYFSEDKGATCKSIIDSESKKTTIFVDDQERFVSQVVLACPLCVVYLRQP